MRRLVVPLDHRVGCVGQGERGVCEKDISVGVSAGTGIGTGDGEDTEVPLGTRCGGKVVGELCVSWEIGISAMEGKGRGAAEEDGVMLETSLPFRGWGATYTMISSSSSTSSLRI